MSKLATISVAGAFAALLSASPSFAANSETAASYEYTKVEIMPMKAHGKTVKVHAMTMADGTIMYAMSRHDLERLLDQKIKDQQAH